MKRIMFCALVVLMTGCAGRVKYPKYYTLDIAPATQPS
jgi:uncharacterized lipoprotein YmbA